MSGNWVGGSSKSKSSGPKLKTIGEFYDTSGFEKVFIMFIGACEQKINHSSGFVK